jgi:hypothetical protein
MANEKALDEFIEDYQLNRKQGISIVKAQDLSQLKSAGYSVEDLLNHLSRNYQSLLHGSRADISDEFLRPNITGKIFAADLAAIAIMRAIISNIGLAYPGLGYNLVINENNPLEIKIYGIKENTIADNGFVYVVNQREGFINDKKSSWQYIRKNANVPISAKISIVKKDFTYPIFDVTNNKRIQ